MQHHEFINTIEEEIKKRGLSRRGLALRAQIPSGRLSEILSGKRPLSAYYTSKLTRALDLNAQHFATTVTSTKKMYHPDRKLKDDELLVIQEWYHMAILNLIKTSNSTLEPQWFAERLSISQEQAEKALRRLLRLKLIEVSENRYIRTNAFLTTSKDISSTALRTMHQQMMTKSQEALHRIPVEFRDISHMVMAINPKKLAEAKEEIRSFRIKMANFLEEGPQEEVYLLGVQLVPLSKLSQGK